MCVCVCVCVCVERERERERERKRESEREREREEGRQGGRKGRREVRRERGMKRPGDWSEDCSLAWVASVLIACPPSTSCPGGESVDKSTTPSPDPSLSGSNLNAAAALCSSAFAPHSSRTWPFPFTSARVPALPPLSPPVTHLMLAYC